MHSGKTFESGRCSFVKLDGDLIITLPSGRRLTYMNCRMAASTRVGWEDNLVIVYDNAVKGKTVRHETYGPKICENIDQASCRDLLAFAMLRLAKEGYAIPLHVHDEIVLEVPEAQAEQARVVMKQIMCEAPEWCPRMPVAAEPLIARRYGK